MTQEPIDTGSSDAADLGATPASGGDPELDEESASGDWAPRLRSFVEEATRIAKEDLADKEITFDETVERAEEVVRKHPLAAVGVAAGVGLLAGILMNRRG